MTIINPWIFYLIDLLSGASDLAGLIMFVSIVLILVLGNIVYLFEGDKLKPVLKKVLVIGAISIVIDVVIPSKQTMYTMLVATNVTTDTIDQAAELIKESVDYIFDRMENE